MRDHHEVGIATVRENPETAHGAAEIFVAALTRLAGAAADPGMRKPAITDLDALGIRTNGHHLTDVLVAKRDRQLHSAIGKAQFLAAAEIEPAFRKMKIAVADAGREDFQQNLAALRLWGGLFIKL